MPETAVADTNLFIRLLTRDDLQQMLAAQIVFEKARVGEISLIIHDLLIAEIIWVLESLYNLDSNSIRERLLALLNTPGLTVKPADLGGQAQAVNIYADKNIDYIDAYTTCWMKAHDISVIYTFNKKHFSRVDGIEVRVPQA